MDNSVKDGGSAFPYTYWDVDSVGETVPRQVIPGMSIRDYFAAQALQGMLAVNYSSKLDYQNWSVPAIHAYQIADTMIAEREKKP